MPGHGTAGGGAQLDDETPPRGPHRHAVVIAVPGLRPGRPVPVHARWRSHGARRVKLAATLELSANGGRTWRTVVAGLTASRFTIPRAALAHAKTVRLRLTVNDGFTDARSTGKRLRVRR